PDVREVGDRHRREPLLGEQRPQSVGAPGVADRRHRASRAATACTARSYPCLPNPMIEPVAAGAITLVWRHGSRALGFEMWTSTTGRSNAFNASWIAHE